MNKKVKRERVIIPISLSIKEFKKLLIANTITAREDRGISNKGPASNGVIIRNK